VAPRWRSMSSPALEIAQKRIAAGKARSSPRMISFTQRASIMTGACGISST
jgi:hypothetical protein